MKKNLGIIERLKTKRSIASALLLVAFISLFAPFAKMSVSSTVSVPLTNISYTTNNYEVGTLNLGGFAMFNSIGETKVGNRTIDSYAIFGINIYDLLTSSPELGGRLDKVIKTLDPNIIDYLRSSELEAQLNNMMPANGPSIFEFTTFIANTLYSTRVIAQNLQPIAENVESTLQVSADAINLAEGVKTVANIIVFLAFALIVVATFIILKAKKHLVLARVFIGLSFIVIASIAVSVPLASNFTNMYSDQIISLLNEAIHTQVVNFAQNLFPNNQALVSMFMGNGANYVGFRIYTTLQWGAIVPLIAMLSAFILTFFFENEDNKNIASTSEHELIDMDNSDLPVNMVNDLNDDIINDEQALEDYKLHELEDENKVLESEEAEKDDN